ncbi:MAG: translation initiation factor IF-3 [Kiritimatiellaeota bacterium]|nr:translation initiation factor IF-3 [Kiritimatiellota bacterium]
MPSVRVIDENGGQLGIMNTREAMRIAESQGLDLVEISPNAEPPVCKIMDFGKFRYEESIKAKTARKNQSRQQVKEIKFHPGTEENDLQVKLRQIRGFIADGDKVKLTLQYRGRENAHKEIGMDVIQRVLTELADTVLVEQQPKHLGRFLGALLAPRPQKTAGKKHHGEAPSANTGAPAPKPRPPAESPATPANNALAAAFDAAEKP